MGSFILFIFFHLFFFYLKYSILFFSQGKINFQGSFDELSNSGVDFSELLKRSDEDEENEKQENFNRYQSSGTHDRDGTENLMTASNTSIDKILEEYEVSWF